MNKKKNKKKNYYYNNNINETKKRDAADANESPVSEETVNAEIEEIEEAESETPAETKTLAIEVLGMSEVSEVSAAEVSAAKVTVEEPAIPETEAAEIEIAEIETAEIETPEVEAPEVFESEINVAEIEIPEIKASEIETQEIIESEIEAAEIETSAYEEEIIESEIEAAEAEMSEADLSANAAAYIVPEAEVPEVVALKSAVPETAKAKTANAAETKASNVFKGRFDMDGSYRKSNSSKTLSDHARFWTVSGLKVIVPVALCIIVIAVIVSFAISKKANDTGDDQAQYIDEPLQENAYENVNEFIAQYFKALSDGDTNAITSIMDYVDNTSLITYEKRSEYIEAYTNITCYTKPGLEENSYFVYAAYDAKVNGIDTVAPGLLPLYVYTAQDGSLKIDGDRDERVESAFKLVTNQDDVVDLYNKIDVKYKEVVASDENLKVFMDELPGKVKTSVGEALAQIEGQNGASAGEAGSAADSQQTAVEQPQNKTTNELVKATATVNVRKSDSENADRIGKVSPGTELTRVEERMNGWSKVLYEGQEAYIKSDYLEAVSTDTANQAAAPTGNADTNNTDNTNNTAANSVKAKTNVNVRSDANQNSEKLGVAQAETSYELLENMGEWYKIKYNGKIGYVKAEYFQ